MLLDLQGLKAYQPFTNDVCPAERERQQCHQLLEPVGIGDLRLFQAEASTLQTTKQRLDLPTARVIGKGLRGKARCDHNHILARGKPHATNKQRQPPERAGPRADQCFADALRAEQPPSTDQLSAAILNFRVLPHPDAKINALSINLGHFDGRGHTEALGRRRLVDDVDVVGIATDHCVRATALDAAREGFGTRVLLDLTAGVARPTVDAALDRLRDSGVELVGEPVVAE